MSAWRVETLDERVDKELEALADDVRASFARIAELIMSHGLHRVREPYVKHILGKLWEMRLKGRDGIARALYVAAEGRRVVVLHAFVKKTEKTPRDAIDIAHRRGREAGLL
ncbi:MAG: type II toxin-antitoxin system RelE/ParE family toxin [Alphaproteobacteria bacterium]|nr:type II toxin-antitoxin system RelE/ParE family toxin [Alphaproteobacteria bacterium]